MGRRKSGRPVSGWLIVDKPAGPTSAAVVNKVRWALDAKKAGHAGTLDPAATGLLAVALGEATKTIPVIADAMKAYRFTVRWGAATDTDDAEGTVIATAETRPARDAILAALPAFTGLIRQVPPQFSAVKVDGERAYALAREGETLELEARSLFVERLVLVEAPDPDTAIFEMVCGKGGYVRAIARDLGEALGCLGHVVTLRRLWSGPFDLDGAIGLDEIEALARTPDLDARLLPLEHALADLPCVRVDALAASRIRHGNPADVTHAEAAPGDFAWAAHEGTALALGHYIGGQFRPSKVLNV